MLNLDLLGFGFLFSMLASLFTNKILFHLRVKSGGEG